MLIYFAKKSNIPNLKGIVINNENPNMWLNKTTWLSGQYQIQKDDYNNDHWAFKELMLRLNNQFYYNYFNQIRVKGFVSGKENYLFSENYVFSAYGKDYIGEEKIKTKLQKAKIIQDTLKKKGIDLLLVFAPGKGEYCIEKIEEKYKSQLTVTNLETFVKTSKQLQLNYLDLKSYFQLLKPITPYPLFTTYGHHWSFYGECLAVDTIIKHIEKLHQCNLPHLVVNKIEVIDSVRSRDADALESMNLLYNPKHQLRLAYPDVSFDDSKITKPTRILTVADSYWYGPVYWGVGPLCFGEGQFWYYNNKIIPNPNPEDRVEVWQLDLKQNIESNEVIMLLYSDANLPSFANTFIDDVYEMYTNPSVFNAKWNKSKIIKGYEKEIRNTPMLLKKVTAYSIDKRIPLDSAIKIEALKYLQ